MQEIFTNSNLNKMQKSYFKKGTILLCIGLLTTFSMSGQNTYCEPTWSGWAINEPTEPITLVQFGQNGVNGIDNPTSDVVSSDTPRYEDFSAVSMDVIKGESYTLKVKGNTDGNNTNYITVYFDWNGDGVFSNSSPDNIEEQQQWTNQKEKHQHGMSLINSTGIDDVEISYTVNIPTDAVLGAIRMRIVKNYNAPSPEPCSNPFIFGQVEDYTINITEETETEYCIPEFFYPSSQAGVILDQISLEGETITWDLNPIVYNADGYADYTSLPSVDLISGNAYDLNFHTNWQDPQYINVRAWIDYNQNSQFDNEEEIGYIDNGIAPSGNGSFNFTVPENTPIGFYRLRVVMQFPNSIPNNLTPCGTINSYGIAIDYNLQVIEDDSSDNYCLVSVDYDVEPITLVDFADLNNQTSAVINGTPAYEDFTSMMANVQQGQTYTITVKGNTVGNFEHDIRVFFDWNQDLEFDMNTEFYVTSLLPSSGEDSVEATIDITVPTDAVLGETRLRIIKDMWNVYEEGEFDACTNAYYGQVEDYTINISESTAPVEITEVVVTTENNVPAEITTENGTLQLVATISPSEANQEVIWSVISGDDFASVDSEGLVTAIANGTATIRATSVEDETKFGEIEVIINIQDNEDPECEAVETFLETFENFTTFPEYCWNANYTNYAVGISDETVQLYSGGASGDSIIIVSPEVSTIDGQHALAFDMVSISQPGTTVQVGTMTDNTDFSTFSAVENTFAPTAGITHTTGAIPVNTGHKYVAIKYSFPQGSHIVLKLDNIEWKEITSGTEGFDTYNLTVYPNPTTGIVNIQANEEITEFKVFNITGQLILKGNSNTLNLDNFTSGIYMIQVTLENNSVHTQKLIKK